MSDSKIRVCFLGTPEFAAQHLQTLLSDQKFHVVGVVTQPDRPAGRKMQLTPSAVKILAVKNNLQILTPENLRNEQEIFEKIKSWMADIAVVVAFGQILNQEFLDSFRLGAVNVHGSLLPLWRGAAPIQRSIEAGDKITGVSLQKIVKKLDAGPILGERKLELNSVMTASDVYLKLANLGCELLQKELLDYALGKINPCVQDESKVTVATKISKEESLLNWSDSAEKIHNKVRAFSMGPGTHCIFQGRRLKVNRTEVLNEILKGKPSEILEINSAQLILQTGQGSISLLEVQPESKPRIQVQDFIKTISFKKGDLFV